MTKPIVILALAGILTASSLMANPTGVPDAGSTGLLLGVALAGVGLGKRFFRR